MRNLTLDDLDKAISATENPTHLFVAPRMVLLFEKMLKKIAKKLAKDKKRKVRKTKRFLYCIICGIIHLPVRLTDYMVKYDVRTVQT